LPGSTVITIGNFDGVHAGHAALIARAREIAGDEGAGPGRVIALAFDPHPLTSLRPDEAPPRLTTFEHRAVLLKAVGADQVVRLRPDARTLHQPADAFVRRLVERFRPRAFVEGRDFRFGRDRAGDVFRLAELGRRLGFGVEVVPPVEVVLTDQSQVAASSTLARWLIAHARVRDAAIVLGRPYTLSGTVIRGDRRGRTIGFPTANLRADCLIPGDGVYAGRARLPSGRWVPAAVSVGTKPTFGDGHRAVEAHLLTRAGTRQRLPGLPEYGWALALEFVGWVRDQVRFESVGALVDQMHRDCERVREIIAGERKEAVCP
jgi:riboflavin kinase/FMN adenylyltransferase